MRFKVGELALVAISAHGHQGKTVCIVQVGPCRFTDISSGKTYVRDYRTDDGAAANLFVDDWQLRKIDPPAEPKCLIRSEEIEHV